MDLIFHLGGVGVKHILTLVLTNLALGDVDVM